MNLYIGSKQSQEAVGFMRTSFATPGGQSSQSNPAGSGLRIKEVKETEEVISAKEAASVKQNFNDTMMSRLTNTMRNNGLGKISTEEATAAMESINAVLDKVTEDFGQGTANQVMATMLTNTKDNLNANRLGSALTSALKTVQLSAATQVEKGESLEEIEKGQEILDKLADLVEFLNKGYDEEEGFTAAENDSEPASLSASLNSLFSPLAEAPEQKIFNDEFSYKAAGDVFQDELNNYTAKQNFWLTMDEFGEGNRQKIVDFLRNEMGEEEAAKIVEEASGHDDIFAVVDEIRTLFKQNEILTDPEAGPALVPQTMGLEKINRLDRFLNEEMIDGVNAAISANNAVKERFDNMVMEEGVYSASVTKFASTDDIPENYGLHAWSGFLSDVDTVGGVFDLNMEGTRHFQVGELTHATNKERAAAQAENNIATLDKETGEDNSDQYDFLYSMALKGYETHYFGNTSSLNIDVGNLVNKVA